MTFLKNPSQDLNYKNKGRSASFLHGVMIMDYQATDIFSFDPSLIYRFYLIEGLKVQGSVIDARDNGIVLNQLQHIPTINIIYFEVIGTVQENETPE